VIYSMMGSNGQIFVLNDSWGFLRAYMVLTIHMFKLDSFCELCNLDFICVTLQGKKKSFFFNVVLIYLLILCPKRRKFCQVLMTKENSTCLLMI
jgi:hypothetical protein